jgi:hypothetical protein
LLFAQAFISPVYIIFLYSGSAGRTGFNPSDFFPVSGIQNCQLPCPSSFMCNGKRYLQENINNW